MTEGSEYLIKFSWVACFKLFGRTTYYLIAVANVLNFFTVSSSYK